MTARDKAYIRMNDWKTISAIVTGLRPIGARKSLMPGAFLGFFVAVVLAWGLGRVPLEISIDVDSPAQRVTAQWAGGEQVLEELDKAWSPHHYQVRVMAPGSGNRDSGGYQVIAMAGIDEVTYSDPSLWANASTYFLLQGPTRPAILTLEGWTTGPSPYLSFETDRYSEWVEVQSGQETPQVLTLQTEERGKLRYPIRTDARRYRYTGSVPRAAAGSLSIVVEGDVRPTVNRLYVNALVPRVYYDTQAPTRVPAGLNIEDWQVPWDGNRIRLPIGFVLGSSFVPSTIMLWAGFFAGWILLSFVARSVSRVVLNLWRTAPVGRFEGPVPLKLCTAFWLPAFSIWCLFLMTFYPGTMNADSLTQWSEIQTFHFTPIHPPVYAVAMWLATFLWDSPASTAFIQILAASLVVGWAFALLWKARVPRVVVLALYTITVLSPRNNTTLISLVKDTPYTIALTLVAVLLAGYLLQPHRAVGWRWACAGFSLGIAAVFRHNGPLVALALLPVLFLYFPKQWRAGVLLLVAFLTVFLGVKQVLYPRLTIERGDGGLHDLTTCHLALLLDRDVPLRTEEYEFLNQVRDLEDRWAYSPRRVASTTLPFLDCYHRTWAKEHSAAYLQHYQDIVGRNILTASLYFLERGEFLYVPWQRNDDMETYFLGISRNDLGLWNMEIFLELPDQLRAILAQTANPSLSWLFWRPALPLYLVLLAGIVLCIRQRSIVWSIVYLPVLINTATIALAAISQATRYQFPLTFAATFLVGLAFLPLPAPPATSKAPEE